MKTNRRTVIAGLAGTAVLARAGAVSAADDVASQLAGAMTGLYPLKGMVAGLCDRHGQRVLTQGEADNGGPLDGDTVFEIGSLTKLFTALALADMVVRGQMAMDDPLGRYLPADVRVPDFDGKPITLRDVATYSPGLPGWPADMPPLGKTFPDYPVERLYRALSVTKLDAAPGTRYVYSNFGYGLLGLALARRAGTDFETLIVSRIAAPLGMESTRIELASDMQARISPGHDRKLAKVADWDMQEAFAGAGAFHSTANDLLKFLAAAMALKPSPLAAAFLEMTRTMRPSDQADTKVVAGWFITSVQRDRLVWKDGGVLGYSSFLGYSAVTRNGIVLLADGNFDSAKWGRHLLNEGFLL
jgi:D-alanyl-D-alanine-carboxypeptidase/D-alanyl-D-alanine-endopeptidase